MKKLLFLLLIAITTIANAKNVVVVGLWPLPPIVSLLSDANLTLIPKASYSAMEHSLIKKNIVLDTKKQFWPIIQI
ncbi:Uncharacterised protein [Campylobacter devanensis]|uniref:hypothetical protein n=1 Tax=Campylobacter devanensis TaxID=3161138 RepID=UPI000A3503A3|nr:MULTISPECIES: hypothetical protein [Campylobacter]SUX01742.1 Uncharacterised protein [Campylobacter lanienae]